MTTIELLREAEVSASGSVELGMAYLRANLRRWGCAGSAIALMERKLTQRPAATMFRVERGGRVTLFVPEPRVSNFVSGLTIVPDGITVVELRRRGKAPRRAFRVGAVEHRKWDRALAAAGVLV